MRTMEMGTAGIAAALMGLVACAPDTDPGQGASGDAPTVETQVTRVTSEDVDRLLPEERLLIDLRPQDTLVHVDQRDGAVDFSRLDVVCPNGEYMPMSTWIANLTTEEEEPILDTPEFLLAQNPPNWTQWPETCQTCTRCPDGILVCYNTCVRGERLDRRRDERPLEDDRYRGVGATPPVPEGPYGGGGPEPDPDPTNPRDPGADPTGNPSGGGSNGADPTGNPSGGGSNGGSSGGGSSGGSSGGGSTSGGSSGGSGSGRPGGGGASSPGGGW